MTVGDRLFQALVPAAEKDRSPSVDLFVLLCVQCQFCLLFILIAVSSDSCWCPGCMIGCVRALNFVHYIRCVKIFYTRRLRTLRELLQKPPYVVAVVEFCVYLIHLSL